MNDISIIYLFIFILSLTIDIIIHQCFAFFSVSEVLHQDGRDLRARPGGQLAPLPPSQDPHHLYLHHQPHVGTFTQLMYHARHTFRKRSPRFKHLLISLFSSLKGC